VSKKNPAQVEVDMDISNGQRMRPQKVTMQIDNAAAVMLGWQHNVRTAWHWVHTSRIHGVVGDDLAALVERSCAQETVVDHTISIALIDALLPERPNVDQLLESASARLDALPIDIGLATLRKHALLFRRSEMRRLIDRATRTRLAEWIGCPLDGLFDTEASDALGMSMERTWTARTKQAPATPLDELDADQLAMEGMTLLLHRSADVKGRSHYVPCALLRLALPICLDRQIASYVVPDKGRNTPLLEGRIHELLPQEYAWLSG